MPPFLSVIVPIYNSEKYLQRCIDSILRQTYRNFELILVDDGSVDQSLKICEKCARDDERIKIISKANGGCVSARKLGVKIASGSYITFVDSDDWIEDDWFENLCNTVQVHDADILIAGFKIDNEGNTEKVRNEIEDGLISGEKMLREFKERMLYSGRFFSFGVYPSVWNKLYKTSLVKDIIPTVDDKITMGEDVALSYPCLEEAELIEVANIFAGYHYCTNADNDQAMTRVYEVSYFEKVHKVYDQLEQRIRNANIQYQLKFYKLYLLILGIERIFISDSLSDQQKILLVRQALERPEYKQIFDIGHIVYNEDCRRLHRIASFFVIKKKPDLLFKLWKFTRK